MKRSMIGMATVGALATVLVAGTAMGQGPRNGAGNGTGPGYGRGNGYGPGYRANAAQSQTAPGPNATAQAPRFGQGYGPGYGQGRGMGAGGWWSRVTPRTPDQQALVSQVTELHNRIRNANWELRTLTQQNAQANQIQAKQQEVANLRNQLQQITTANQALIQEMGVPAGAGGL